jgi:hypothetical protein
LIAGTTHVAPSGVGLQDSRSTARMLRIFFPN